MTDLTIIPARHPSAAVRRIGRHLDDPYLEWCWAPLLGPSCTLLLRRVGQLWATECPLVIADDELARSVGIEAGMLTHRVIPRLIRFQFATWGDEAAGALAVHAEVPQVPARWLGRLPAPALAAHHALTEMALT